VKKRKTKLAVAHAPRQSRLTVAQRGFAPFRVVHDVRSEDRSVLITRLLISC
jgi:hypothetical protein